MSCTACTDAWTWVAAYRDGSRLDECDGYETHHVFADIDLDALERLTWVPRHVGLPPLSVRIDEPGMRPILFRRRLLELSLSGAEVGRETIHCLGWKRTLPSGGCVESFTFMFADGSLLTTPNRNAV